MTKLKRLRDKLNLTQEELAEKSGISVRSIQRIEAGARPKGHTLKALVKALGINEASLLEKNIKQKEPNYTLIKYINLSSILFIVLPPLNIIVPIIIMYTKKEFNPLTRQIVSLQILWTFFFIIFFLIGIVIKNWFFLSNKVNLILLLLPIIFNLVIIIRNTAEIDRQKKLYVKLNFSII